MTAAFVLFYLAASMAVALGAGVGACFALMYLPALLLLRPISGIDVPSLPPLTCVSGATVAMGLAMLLKLGQKLPFRPKALDWIMLAAPAAAVVSEVKTVHSSGINQVALQLLGWVIPYFVARCCISSERFGRQCLASIITCLAIITPFTLIEMRLWPQFYIQTLTKLGLDARSLGAPYGRFGLFRAETSFQHPIYMGDACLVLIGLIVLLGASVPGGLKNRWVQAALAAATADLIFAFSLGPLAGLTAAAAAYVALRYVGFARRLLVPAVIIAIAIGAGVMAHLAQIELGERPEGDVEGSAWVRHRIVADSWQLAISAGPWGWGRDLDSEVLQIESIDNAYLLFAMCRGWVYLALFLLIPVCIAYRATRAFLARRASREHLLPLAAAVGAALGMSLAFCGVWAGWSGESYTMLWLILLGSTMTACDWCIMPATLQGKRTASFHRPGLSGRGRRTLTALTQTAPVAA